jgi:TolB-like protein/DNA-binding SARP family transcriptional activator
MGSLQLVLLGGFQLHAAGRQIDIPGRKERALLAVLAIPAGEPRSRDKLAGLLWSDRAGGQARESLKQAVFKLRRSLDGVVPAPLLADRDFVRLERAAVAVDVAEFERLVGDGSVESLTGATALYRGDLLDGLDLRDPAFDEWLLMERQRLRNLAREALAKLLDRHITSGAYDQAGDTARRLLSFDPLREDAHRALMQVFAAQGQSALALKQYQLCRDALQSELGIRPEPETERLLRSIQEKRATSRRIASETPTAPALAAGIPIPDTPLPDPDPLMSGVAKPSIAVLPFTNLSTDPEQEFFADGLTEDIINALSRISGLWVISRGSTFTYKGKATDVKQVGRDLGVEYVMEGSVRRAGERLRISAGLVDAATGRQVWAQRYERALADLFDIQDEITRSVAAETQTQLWLAEAAAGGTRPFSDSKARDLGVRAWVRLYDQTPEAIMEASELVEQAIRLEPSNPIANRAHALVFFSRLWFGVIPRDAANMARGFELARTSLRLAPHDEYAHLVMAYAHAYAADGQLEEATAECERGLEINPNCSILYANIGAYLATLGRAQEAIDACRLALKLNPRDPSNFWRHYYIAVAHFVEGDYAACLSHSKRLSRSRPFLASGIMWAAAAAGLKDAKEARAAADYCLGERPDLRVESVAPAFMLRFAREEDQERLMSLLREAGLPG